MTHTLGFGDDGSTNADRAWKWISSQRWPGWRLEVVTADPPADLHPVETEEAELRPWDPDRPRQAPGSGFEETIHLRAAIDPRLALIVKSWDLLAIGPRGSGGVLLKTLHLGSTADWLLRQPRSPLVIAREPGPVKRVLVADDGSAHARRAVETLQKVPWLEGTSIRVLTVEGRSIEAETVVERAGDALGSGGGQVETVVRQGNPTKVILEEIENDRPDLVVMGARGLGGIKRLALGSTTLTVTGATDGNVLVAHALTEHGG